MMFRITMLTVSVTPVSARQMNVSQKLRDTPKITVASPYPTTAQSKTDPRRWIWSTTRTMTALANTAPTEGAAYSQPYPLAPTRSTSCAKIGNSAVADEKNVTKKSSSMVERIMGEENTKRS